MRRYVLLILLATALVIGVNVILIHPILGELRSAVKLLQPSTRAVATMTTTYSSTWKDAENITHTVSTPRNAGETATEHAERHAADVAALAALFPPVGDGQ